MRCDLSKVTRACYGEFDASLEALEGELTMRHLEIFPKSPHPHSRCVTLLFQSLSKTSRSCATNSNDTLAVKTPTWPPAQPTGAPEICQFKLMNVFPSYTAEESEKLKRLFGECHGVLPSRRQLSAIAQAMGIAQGRIRKFFQREANTFQHDGFPAHSKPMLVDGCADQEDTEFWQEVACQLDCIDETVIAIQGQLDSLNDLLSIEDL
jgi:hypothetical protein